MNNKVLLAILVLLLAVFAFSKMFMGSENSSFDPVIIKVDPAAVTKIKIQSKADQQQEAVLTKSDENWVLLKDGQTYQADAEAINNLLGQMTAIKTNYIAAKSADKWSEYELQADQSSHLTVYAGNQELADFYVGKFSVNQQAQQITSFFRVSDKEDIYAVIGMAGMMFGQGADNYRNKKLLDLTVADINSLNYDGDQVYQIKKDQGLWLLDGDAAIDSTKARNFLMNLASMSGDQFIAFDEKLHTDKLLKTLTITGNNLAEPVVVRCWRDDSLTKPFVIQSSQHPTSYFTSDSTRLFTRLFKGVDEW